MCLRWRKRCKKLECQCVVIRADGNRLHFWVRGKYALFGKFSRQCFDRERVWWWGDGVASCCNWLAISLLEKVARAGGVMMWKPVGKFGQSRHSPWMNMVACVNDMYLCGHSEQTGWPWFGMAHEVIIFNVINEVISSREGMVIWFFQFYFPIDVLKKPPTGLVILKWNSHSMYCVSASNLYPRVDHHT